MPLRQAVLIALACGSSLWAQQSRVASLLARVIQVDKSNPPGNEAKLAELLAAHADVVGVEREKWSLDSFAGVIKDGYVYFRGAIDFKGGLAVFARAVQMPRPNSSDGGITYGLAHRPGSTSSTA